MLELPKSINNKTVTDIVCNGFCIAFFWEPPLPIYWLALADNKHVSIINDNSSHSAPEKN